MHIKADFQVIDIFLSLALARRRRRLYLHLVGLGKEFATFEKFNHA